RSSIEDGEPHRSPLFRCAGQRRKRVPVLPARLADSGTHHDLEYLILTQARGPDGGDVLVGHAVGVVGPLLDQRAHRFTKTGIVEGGAAQVSRRLPIAVEDASDERAMQL